MRGEVKGGGEGSSGRGCRLGPGSIYLAAAYLGTEMDVRGA